MVPRGGLLRTNAGIAAGTALSRITGYGRVLALAYLMQTSTGTGGKGSQLSAAYFLANTTPNIIYDLILGGILSATLVPLFTQAFEDKDSDAVNAIVTTAAAALVAVTAVATLAAPLIIKFYTAVRLDPDVDAARYRSVSTTLAYFFLPQVFFYGITAIATALLNARRHFFAAAWAPVLNNVIVIAMLLLARSVIDEAPGLELVQSSPTFRWLLGFGATAGVVAMALVLLPALTKAGVHIKPRLDWRHPAIKKLVRLSGWTAGYVVANQIAFLIVTQLAQRSSGGFTAYSTMYIFFQLPYGLLAVTVMTTLSPELARDIAHRDRDAFRRRVRDGLWLIVLLMVPASIVMAIFAGPIAKLAGSFGEIDAAPGVLAAFSCGLVGFSAYLYFMRGFYAMHNTKTPFVINVVENILNIFFAYVLVGRYGVKGLAWSFTLAYLLSALLAYWVLSLWSGGLQGSTLARGLSRLTLVASGTAIAAWAARDNIVGSGAALFGRLGFASAIILGIYVLLLKAFGLLDAARARTLMPGNRPRTKGASPGRRDG
ncbi:MAG: murein biosynthesis integral membrane protein MurJ [Acidimicrobiales bacterium]